MPMVAPCLTLVAVHALLHDSPMAIFGDDKAMQIQVEAILDGRAINLSYQPAGPNQRGGVESDTLGQRL